MTRTTKIQALKGHQLCKKINLHNCNDKELDQLTAIAANHDKKIDPGVSGWKLLTTLTNRKTSGKLIGKFS